MVNLGSNRGGPNEARLKTYFEKKGQQTQQYNELLNKSMKRPAPQGPIVTRSLNQTTNEQVTVVVN